MRRQRKHKHKKAKRLRRSLLGVRLLIEYKGLNWDKDNAIRDALDEWSDGSGFLFGDIDGVRDHSATVPSNKLQLVLRRLRAIKGIKIKRLVEKWVRVR